MSQPTITNLQMQSRQKVLEKLHKRKLDLAAAKQASHEVIDQC